jgi:SAM-dependent MidA family methyltransferase
MTSRQTDEFASITESSALVDELRARIQSDGSITFREFMDAALYHQRYGYYTTGAARTSRGGDYVTNPEVHPVFGALVCKQLLELWRALDRPDTFTVVEAGAGRGLLARDILVRAQLDPDFSAAVRYCIVEPRDALRAIQQETLTQAGVFAGSKVRWEQDFPTPLEGCIITNELLDAFPVHRVVRRADTLQEVYVTVDAGGLRDELGALSDPRLSAYFDALGVLPGDGCYAEVNLDAPAWIARAASALARGYVLTFDYGYEAPDLYAPWRRDGTLLCFYRQSVSSDPYQRIGKQDITASVDFTTLRRAGEDAGLHTIAMTDQAQFLVRMGIAAGLEAVATGPAPQIEEYFARRNVVLDLIDPAKLGRIKVLLQAKDAPDAAFTGFTDA